MFRPWGSLQWILKGCSPKAWSLLACLGTERRSLATWELLKGRGAVALCQLLCIHDGPSRNRRVPLFDAETKARLAERQEQFLRSGGTLHEIKPHQLLESHNEIIRGVDAFIGTATADIILDVTSLPKRFFFPAIKRLLQNRDVRNLVVTYAIPQSYPTEPLALNHNDWAQLPLFAGNYSPEPAKLLIVGVGFEALGLPEQVEHGSGLPVKLLLPFPAPPSSFQRSWELIRKLQAHRAEEDLRVYRVDAKNPSDTFDQLMTLTNGGTVRAELAPFGPKPMSVAMCLFASVAGSPVYYTQPTAYHPDYSFGVAEIDGESEIYGYGIRLEDRDLFSLK